jgi:hypothetical protein
MVSYLQNQLETTKRDLQFAEADVNAAINAVVWASPEVRRVFHDLRAAQSSVLELRATCNTIGAAPKDLAHCFASAVLGRTGRPLA